MGAQRPIMVKQVEKESRNTTIIDTNGQKKLQKNQDGDKGMKIAFPRKGNSDILDAETLLELEEVDPHDQYSKSEVFEKSSINFFKEADLEDKFRFQSSDDLSESTIKDAVIRITENVKQEQSLIDILIKDGKN